MSSVHLFKNVKLLSRIFNPRFTVLYSNFKQISNDSTGIFIKSPISHVSQSLRCFSNCNSMQTKDSDTVTDKNENEKINKILEDQEFQSILKDFANDFGVDKETNELLEDIRKNVDGDYQESTGKLSKHVDHSETPLGGGLDHKYKEFSDADSSVIHSYEEFEDTFQNENFYHIDQELKPRSRYTNLKRGTSGVFDIDDMIQVLRQENLLDIVTIAMPTDDNQSSCAHYVLVTAKSHRHCEAVAESIKKLYKKKKNREDPFITVEGAKDSGWRVIDLGNIVLHIFLEEIRDKYDIESCKLLDGRFDSGGNAEIDPMLNILEEQMEFFNSLNQSKSTETSKDVS